MKKLVLFFLLIFSINSLAQRSNEFNLILFPQGYGIKFLNSSGTSSIFNDVSNLGFMNPASISEFENHSLCISYQFNSSIDEAWIADIGTSRVYNFYPQSFAGIVKWNDFTFGLGFGQHYNGTKDFDPMPVTTFQQPDGTGEFIDIIEENSINNYSLSVAYSLIKLFESTFNINLGLRYSLNRLHQYVKLWDTEVNSTGYYSSFGLGLTSEFNIDAERKLTTGIFFESENKFKANLEYERPPILYDIDPIDSNRIYAITSSPDILYNTPSELSFDLVVDAAEELKFLTKLTSVFWATGADNLKDQIEFSFSAVYKINEMFSPSLGFYMTDCEYTDNFYSRLNEGLNALFMTAGLKFNYAIFSADLAIADSHLFSGDFRKQTILKLALGYTL
jgi:hypothetical protein